MESASSLECRAHTRTIPNEPLSRLLRFRKSLSVSHTTLQLPGGSRISAFVSSSTPAKVLSLVGHAGLGKTQLVEQVRASTEPGVTWLVGQGRSYGAAALCGPFVEMLRGWIDVTTDSPEIVVRTRLRARCAGVVPDDVSA